MQELTLKAKERGSGCPSVRIPSYRNEPCWIVPNGPNAQMGLLGELVQQECEFEALLGKYRQVKREGSGLVWRIRTLRGDFDSLTKGTHRQLCCVEIR